MRAGDNDDDDDDSRVMMTTCVCTGGDDQSAGSVHRLPVSDAEGEGLAGADGEHPGLALPPVGGPAGHQPSHGNRQGQQWPRRGLAWVLTPVMHASPTLRVCVCVCVCVCVWCACVCV